MARNVRNAVYDRREVTLPRETHPYVSAADILERAAGDGGVFKMKEASQGKPSRVDRYSQGTSLANRDASEKIINDNNPGVKGKFSASEDEIRTIQGIGEKSVNDFTSEELEICTSFANKYFKELGTKSPFFRAWFGDWRENDKTPVLVADELGSARGEQLNDDTGWSINISGKVFNETAAHRKTQNVMARKYLPYIKDIVKKAEAT